jgi:hypothetical protein
MKKKKELEKLLKEHDVSNAELTDKILILFGIVKSYYCFCDEPEPMMTIDGSYYCEICKKVI